jgi:hypothetical protein
LAAAHLWSSNLASDFRYLKTISIYVLAYTKYNKMMTLTMVTFLGLISSQVTLAQFSSSISSSSASVCDAFNDIPDSSYGDFWKESIQ